MKAKCSFSEEIFEKYTNQPLNNNSNSQQPQRQQRQQKNILFQLEIGSQGPTQTENNTIQKQTHQRSRGRLTIWYYLEYLTILDLRILFSFYAGGNNFIKT